MTYDSQPKRRPKEFVISTLGRKKGFSAKLSARLKDMTFDGVPNVNPECAQVPDNAVEFSTADGSVYVFCSSLDGEEVVLCMADMKLSSNSGDNIHQYWGDTIKGEAEIGRVLIGGAISTERNKARSVCIMPITPDHNELLELRVGQDDRRELFMQLISKMEQIIEVGNVNQGFRQFRDENVGTIQF